ncbi:hypothetical protein GCM10010199_09610 [Dactylosporangium roseum]
MSGVRVIEVFQVPTAVLGELTDGVTALGDELPQALRGAHPAGKVTRHAHHGHRLGVLLLGLLETLPRVMQIRRDPLQVID